MVEVDRLSRRQIIFLFFLFFQMTFFFRLCRKIISFNGECFQIGTTYLPNLQKLSQTSCVKLKTILHVHFRKLLFQSHIYLILYSSYSALTYTIMESKTSCQNQNQLFSGARKQESWTREADILKVLEKFLKKEKKNAGWTGLILILGNSNRSTCSYT